MTNLELTSIELEILLKAATIGLSASFKEGDAAEWDERGALLRAQCERQPEHLNSLLGKLYQVGRERNLMRDIGEVLDEGN